MAAKKITEDWLKTHKWMLRSSNNGISYGGFKWPPMGKWNNCPDWNTKPECGGGFHGETPDYNGFGFLYGRIELVEYIGESIPIDENKVKVKQARIVAVGTNIPEAAFTACGYKIAHNGDTITPARDDRWLVLEGHVTVSNQSGGYCWFRDSSQGTVSNQSFGYCWFCDSSQGTVSNQSFGYCRFYDSSQGTVSNQSGGDCWFYDSSQGTVSNQSGGYCRFCDSSQGTVSNQSGDYCLFYDSSKRTFE